MEVYNTLGSGLLESIYHKALKHELEARGLKVVSEMPVEVYYKGVLIEDNAMRLDIIVEDRIIVELKSVESLYRFISSNCEHICDCVIRN